MKEAGWIWNQETGKYDKAFVNAQGKVIIIDWDDKYPRWITYGSK